MLATETFKYCGSSLIQSHGFTVQNKTNVLIKLPIPLSLFDWTDMEGVIVTILALYDHV